jgi:hypothetical protein
LANVIATMKEAGLLMHEASADPSAYIDDSYLREAGR